MNDLVSAWQAVHDEKQDIYHLDLKPDIAFTFETWKPISEKNAII